MKRRSVFGVLTVLLAIVIVSGCADQTSAAPLTVEQVIAQAKKHNGKTINVEAFYFHRWETIVLADRLEPSGYAPGHLVPKGTLIWVEGGIPKETYDRLYVQQQMGPSERIGKLRIKGKLEYGGKYGHVGGFDAQITPLETELLPWTPPQ